MKIVHRDVAVFKGMLNNGDFLKMANGMDDVKSKFTWANFVEGIETLYARL